MSVAVLHGPPAPPLRDALAEFERQFVYPLGPGRTFRIEHGDDYPRFYRAVGDARCFVHAEDGRVLSVVSVAIRPVRVPDGRVLSVAYIGDVKAAPGPRRGAALLRAVRVALPWCRERAAAAFGVVMDGTPTTPGGYTGRLGIPAFAEVGKVIVFRFLCVGPGGTRNAASGFTVPEEVGRACFHRLRAGRFACAPGTPAERSQVAPLWLVHPDETACGCVEDTRRGKRLVADDGAEMVSAHLSAFAYRDVLAGAALLRHAIDRAREADFPALFVSVAAEEAPALRAALSDVEAVQAPATVFAHGFERGAAWIINSSEI